MFQRRTANRQHNTTAQTTERVLFKLKLSKSVNKIPPSVRYTGLDMDKIQGMQVTFSNHLSRY